MQKYFYKYSIALFTCLLILQSAGAQDNSITTVYFPSNGFSLSVRSRHRIDSAIASLSNFAQAYKVQITGHTDNAGSEAANKQLSLKRANTVANYLTNKNFRKTKLLIEAKGESDPVANNETEEGMAMNRRVSIAFIPAVKTPGNIGGLTLEDNRYEFDNSKGGQFNYPSGSIVFVSPSSFVEESGNPVTGTIILQYREYRDPVDFILRGIPMSKTINQTLYHFNSGGMFEILAFKDNKPVYLKPGKPINISFRPVQQLPDMNYYRFDTIDHHWENLAPLTNAMGSGINHIGGEKGNSSRDCYMGDCDAMMMIVNMGAKYAGNNIPATERLSKSLSLNAVRDSLQLALLTHRMQIDSMHKANELLGFYKIYEQSSSRSGSVFSIQKKNGSPSPYNGVSIKFNPATNGSTTAFLMKHNWKDIALTGRTDKGKYTIQFFDLDTVLSFYPAEVLPDKKMKKKEKKQMAATLVKTTDSIAGAQQQVREAATKSEGYLQAQNEKIATLLRSTAMLDPDSLFCFWDHSKPYMDSSEQKLGFENWLNYFDDNRAAMLDRYTRLKSDPRYEFCLQLSLQAERMAELQKKADTMGVITDKKMKEFRLSLSVPVLGIYNCDQLQRLNNPVEVFADYADQNGKKIEPLIIYVIDSRLNGMLKYDGNYGYGPLHFAFSPSSKNVLIAFDERGRTYIFPAKKFAEIKPDSQVIRYHFRLTAVNDLSSKDELRKMLW